MTNNDHAARIILSPLVLRIAWQVAPSTMICCLFWLAAARWDIAAIRATSLPWSRRLGWISFAGVGMNALVTIVNGGYMPFVGDGPGFSLWVNSADAHVLLWLADYDAWWGFSLGDGFILGGMLAQIVYWAGRRLAAARRVDVTLATANTTRQERLRVSLHRDAAGWRP